VENFLKEHNIPYVFKNLVNEKMTKEEIEDILSLTNNGFDDLVSTKTSSYKKLNIKFDEILFNDAIQLIIDHPEILHRPITVQYLEDKPLRLLIGYNNSDILILLRKDDEKFFSHHPCGFHNDYCHSIVEKEIEDNCLHDKN
jgi:regulatory protein spx